MRSVDYIKNIIGKRMSGYGFEYAGYEKGRWKFTKQDCGVIREIIIQKSPWEKAITLIICTSIRKWPLEFKDYVTGSKRPSYCNYDNEMEFCNILTDFADEIEKYSIKKLEELSKPLTKYAPTKEMYLLLYKQGERLDQEEQKTCEENESMKQIITAVEQQLKILSAQSFQDVEQKLIEITAFYGEGIKRFYGGRWMYSNQSGICFINEMNSVCVPSYDPLKIIVYVWENQEFTFMYELDERMAYKEK